MVAEMKSSNSGAEKHVHVSPLLRARRLIRKTFGRVEEHITVDRDTQLTLLTSGRQVFDEAKKLIQTATHHSNLQSYSYDMDPVGYEFVDTFRQTKRENPSVEQNVVIDNSTRWWNHNGFINQKKEARERHDETFRELNKLTHEGVINGWITNWFHIFHRGSSSPFFRDHKKIITADGERAIVTTANIGIHHVEWRDIGVRLDGPAARVVEDDVWHTIAAARKWHRVHDTGSITEYLREHGKEISSDPESALYDLVGAVVRNPSRRGRKIVVHEPSGNEIQVVTDGSYFYLEATRAAHQMIDTAEKGDRVSVMSPYPGLVTLTRRMLRAAKKGALVDLYIPHKNTYSLYNPKKIKFGPLRAVAEAYVATWKKLLKQSGVTIYEYTGNGGMNHAKAVSVSKKNGDQEVLIGSMNLNMGPLAGLNREMGVVTNDRKFGNEFSTFLEEIRAQSVVG